MQFSSTSCSPDDESHENGLWPQCIYLNFNWKRFRSQPGLFDWTKGKDGRWIWPQCIFDIWIINEQFWFEEYWFSAGVTRLEMSRRPDGPAARLLSEKLYFATIVSVREFCLATMVSVRVFCCGGRCWPLGKSAFNAWDGGGGEGESSVSKNFHLSSLGNRSLIFNL